jgi:glycine cleavage system transcriptional repressor
MAKTKKISSTLLSVALITENRDDVLNQLTKTIAQSHCTIIESRANVLGKLLAAYLLITGKWNQIAKAEALLTSFQAKHGGDLCLRRTETSSNLSTGIPYMVYATSVDDPTYPHKLTNFFTEKGIEILEMSSHTYRTRHSETRMLSLTIRIKIPVDLQFSEIRDSFIIFCDALNVDAVLEPEKY